jgi:mycothiol synthase
MTDLQAMVDLLASIRAAERMADYPSPADLQELLSRGAIEKNTRLWENEAGELVAYAFVDSYNNLWFEIGGRARGTEIESQVVEWGVECVRRGAQKEGASATLDACCREDDAARRGLLERQGFVEQPVWTLRMARSLAGVIAEPQLPEGFVMRHVEGEGEVEALVTLHQAAHGTENVTVEERLSWMRVPEYDPELDLVVVAPDGELAAYCLCQVSEVDNARTGRKEGWTDPVATHPAYQGRGLASALLLRGMQLLKERGMEAAVLGTSSENAAMQRVAEKVGFKVKSVQVWYEKRV